MLNRLLLAQPQDETDPNFKNVTLLLQGDGTNGGQNNTFVDSSTNNFTITRNGNTTQGSFSPYGDLWSNYFDGNGDYLQTGTISVSIGTGNFTIEMWVYPSQQDAVLFDARSGSTSNRPVISYVGSTFRFYSSMGDRIVSAANYPLNQWYHVAAVRNSGTTTLYVNGTSVGTYADTTNYGTATRFRIGAYDDGAIGAYLLGYLSNLRFVTSAVYTTNFTPPTAPLTAITNTSLLTCQSNRFIDNSSNNFTITCNGDVSVQRFSPFSPTAAYSAATIGGSGYFDGTGDYLGIASTNIIDFGTGDFEISYWYYPTVAATTTDIQVHIGNSVSSSTWSCGIGGSTIGAIYFTTSTVGYQTTAVAQPRAWNFITWSRVSGTLRGFLNGVQVLSTAFTTSLSATSCGIGAVYSGSGAVKSAYISNIRLVKGSGVTSVSVPTTPLTAITNTSLLLNFTNASIFDNAMMADLETVGNAQIDTSIKKYGTGSLEFDGNGDYLIALDNASWDFGTGDFTIEAWVYFNSLSTRQAIVGNYQNSTTGWVIQRGSGSDNNKLHFGYGDPTLVESSSLSWSANQWYHIAVTRSGSSLKLFRDGTEVASVTNSTNISGSSSSLFIGALNAPTLGIIQVFNGYIDDLRITKGVARYTANFTPPTQSLPTK